MGSIDNSVESLFSDTLCHVKNRFKFLQGHQRLIIIKKVKRSESSTVFLQSELSGKVSMTT